MSSPVLDTNASTLVLEEAVSSKPRFIAVSEVTGLALLTPCIMLIHGYHPFADDAGIYVAGIRKMLNPSLFLTDSSFVVTHTHWSIFSHLFAGILRLFHIPLEIGLIASYLLSIFAFLLGCLRLSQRLFTDVHLQRGATLLAGALFTLPVAATALTIMDPYVTARSFSTPLSIFAVAACLGRDWKRMALWLLAVSALHPLMAVYLAAFLVTCILAMKNRWNWLATSCLAAFAISGIIFHLTRHAILPYGYREAVLTRSYFFLSEWHWYELLGIVAPLLLMSFAALRVRNIAIRNLCITSVAVGTTATATAVCFIHTSGSFLLARLQPLRSFQLIYIVGVVLLGGFLAEYLRGGFAALGAVLLIFTSGLMLLVQNQSYTASAHVEWPFAIPSNPWQQAFLWIRHNTPADAVFALDPNYIKLDSEDTQGFRAMTARSALADELKDGGVVAIFPELAPRWKTQRDLEVGLNQMSDQQRIERLRGTGVTWVLLAASASTQLDCPLHNSAVLVCRLPLR